MSRYLTKTLWYTSPANPILPVGSVVTLSDAEAEMHLAQRTIELIPEPAPEAPPAPVVASPAPVKSRG